MYDIYIPLYISHVHTTFHLSIHPLIGMGDIFAIWLLCAEAQGFVWTLFFSLILLGKYLGKELLGHILFDLLRNHQNVFLSSCTIMDLQQCRFQSLHNLTNTCFLFCFVLQGVDFFTGYPSEHEVISHCGSDLHFSND